MTITLEQVKAEQTKLGEMIAKIEAEMKEKSFFVFAGQRIALELGERYVGTIITADGSRNYHLILLPGDQDGAPWKKQTEWAKSIGGELPDRVESALLFSVLKDEFKEAWYWTRDPHPSGSGYAFIQDFPNGNQSGTNANVSYGYRARAVRRLEIQ